MKKVEPYKITDVKDECSTYALSLKTATYIDKNGKERPWNYVTRNKTKNVVSMACKNKSGKYVVIKQSRIPVGGRIVYGFPGGVIEVGEDPEDTVRKEMREETGYDVKKITSISPFLSKSAGLTDESSKLAQCVLGKKGDIEPEETEDIEVLFMSPKEVIRLGRRIDPDKEVISSGLWSYMLGKSRHGI